MKRLFILCVAALTMFASCGKNGGEFIIAQNGKNADIIIDSGDWKGVIRAANDLGDDVKKVSVGLMPLLRAFQQADTH